MQTTQKFLNVNTEADADILVTILRKLNLSYAECDRLSVVQCANVIAGRLKDVPYTPPDAVRPQDKLPLDAMGGLCQSRPFCVLLRENESANPVLLQRAYFHSPPIASSQVARK